MSETTNSISKVDYEQMIKQANAMAVEYEAINVIKCDCNRQNCAALSEWQGSASDVYANAAGSMEMGIANRVSKLTTMTEGLIATANERAELDQEVSKAADGSSGA